MFKRPMCRYLLRYRCVQSSAICAAAPCWISCHTAVANLLSKVQLHRLCCSKCIGMTATCAWSKLLYSNHAALPPCPAAVLSPTYTQSFILMTPSHCISCALSFKQHVSPHSQFQTQAGLLLSTLLTSCMYHMLLMPHG